MVKKVYRVIKKVYRVVGAAGLEMPLVWRLANQFK